MTVVTLLRPLAVGLALALGGGVVIAPAAGGASYDGKLQISVLDEQTRQPLPVRMELRDARGRAVRARPEGALVAGESIFFDGETTLALRRGAYTFLIEAGPEFITRPGHFTIDRHADDSTEVLMQRRVDMRAEGWWAGDLDVQASPVDLALAMRARGVDVAPVSATVNLLGRCRKLKPLRGDPPVGTPLAWHWAELDQRRGGGLLAIAAEQPVDVCQWKADDPSLPAAEAARAAGAMVVARSPDAWDLPLWAAAGVLDAVQIIGPDSRPTDDKSDRSGRPRDTVFFPGRTGAGRYHETIYHHLLQCGLRIPPAAGSGFGGSGRGDERRLLGENRVYVHCGESCTWDSWLAGLRAGQVSVTNGPLLRVSVEGEQPGAVFQLEPGERRQFQIALNLAFYEQTQVEYLEIVQNGEAVHQVRLDELAQGGGRLPAVEFDSSGWFLVRAVTNNSDFYQYATSGPFYVESNYRKRISRRSAEFFLEWLGEAADQFAGNPAVLAEIEAARPFWQELRDKATAD